MVYPHKVKHNGVWYQPGEEVPTGDAHLSDEKTDGVATKSEKVVEEITAKRRGRKPKV